VDLINQKLSDKPVGLIPLPGIKDGFVEYKRLLLREKKRKEYYIHNEDKPTEKHFKISDLLEGFSEEDIAKNQDNENASAILLQNMKADLDEIKKSIERMKDKLFSHYECLLNHLKNNLTKDDIQDALKDINNQQMSEVLNEIMNMLANAFEKSNDKIDAKFREIYNDLKETDDVQMKLSLSIPFINMLGIDLGMKFDIKNWVTRMYKQYGLRIFELMGNKNS
jgi:hypothetical protein